LAAGLRPVPPEHVSAVIKLSSPATREFWEIPILYEDEHLLALNKPACILASPDRSELEQPNLVQLLHSGIEQAKPWAKERGLVYLMNAHRLDFETSGVLLLGKNKPAFAAVANLLGAGRVRRKYIALVRGVPAQDRFEIEAKLSPHPVRPGIMRVDAKQGKQSHTICDVLERFSGHALLKCEALTDRPGQIRLHLRHAALTIVGDRLYGGRPLLLSQMKRDYRLKPDQTERPLIDSAALHAEEFSFPHPMTNAPLVITAPWPKDLRVAVKYLQRYGRTGRAGQWADE